MNNINLRIISKIGLLFVVIGFFLPISCNLNGFQIAKSAETYGSPTILSISLYSIFIFSCIGIILLFALLMKYKFSIGYDWADLLVIITAFSVFMYIHIKSSDDPLIELFNRLQSGAYIIFIGLICSLFFLIAATWKSIEKNREVHGTTQITRTTDKVFIGEKVLGENKIKKIKIREKLFKKIPRRLIKYEDIIVYIGTIIAILLGFYVWLQLCILLVELIDNFVIIVILLLIIALYLAIFLTLYLLGLIVLIIYGKKIFVYWCEFSCYDDLINFLLFKFKKLKNKKVHVDLFFLWCDWEDYYRKGKGILSPNFITIPFGFTAIGKFAFSNYTSLPSINIPASVKSIGDYAFYNCTSLASVTIPEGVTSIGEYAFFCCTNLANITIPNSVTTISSSAFCDCTSLASITIPASVTSIGEWEFSGCTNMQTINVPFANADAKPSGWDANWNKNCDAVIKYWNGTTWE